MTRYQIIAYATLITTAAAAVYAYSVKKTDPCIPSETFESSEVAHWMECIHTKGPEEAVRNATRRIPGKEFREAHLRMHPMGGALYATLGMRAHVYCAADPTGGCIHGFFEEMRLEKGVAALDSLSAYCKETEGIEALYCAHGMGHALVATSGPMPENLNSVFEACAHTPRSDLTIALSCVEGAVMETVPAYVKKPLLSSVMYGTRAMT